MRSSSSRLKLTPSFLCGRAVPLIWQSQGRYPGLKSVTIPSDTNHIRLLFAHNLKEETMCGYNKLNNSTCKRALLQYHHLYQGKRRTYWGSSYFMPCYSWKSHKSSPSRKVLNVLQRLWSTEQSHLFEANRTNCRRKSPQHSFRPLEFDLLRSESFEVEW